MNDIAWRLGITKAALYKHYTSKQEILDRIVERMNETDDARAREYEMPEAERDSFAEAYLHTPTEKIRAYSEAQFDHYISNVGNFLHRSINSTSTSAVDNPPVPV